MNYLLELVSNDTREVLMQKEVYIDVLYPDVQGWLIMIAGDKEVEDEHYSLNFHIMDFMKIDPNDHGHFDVTVFDAFATSEANIIYEIETEPGDYPFDDTDWSFGEFYHYAISDPVFVVTLIDGVTGDVIETYEQDISQFIGMGWDIQMVLLDMWPDNEERQDYPYLLAAPHREGWLTPPRIITALDESEEMVNHKLHIYPNPVTDRITLLWNVPESGKLFMEAMDSKGQSFHLLTSKIKVSGTSQLSVSAESLSPGFYILRCLLNGKMYTAPFVVKR